MVVSPQSAFAQRDDATKNIAFVLSGGVSLGAYQAGFMYYVTETAKLNNKADLRVFTGASAGSINSFLSILEGCRSQRPVAPQESLFWKTWIPLGLNELIVSEDMTRNAMFSRRQLQSALTRIKQIWLSGLPKSCHVVFGISVTRRIPEQVQFSSGLRLNRSSEQIAIEIKGQGPGRSPQISNFYFGHPSKPKMFVVFAKNGAERIDDIANLLFASSAFPLAFPPVRIKHCLLKKVEFEHGCKPNQIQNDEFVDGGIFDNWPINMANELAMAFKPVNHRQTYFVYLDINAKSFPIDLGYGRTNSQDVLSLSSDLLLYMLEHARHSELHDFLIENPDLAPRILSTQAYLPLASEPLEGFWGFLEEDFRRFDFLMGMHDAQQTISGMHIPDLVQPETLAKQDMWRKLRCIVAFFSTANLDSEECSRSFDDSVQNLVSLYKVSVKRLYDHCRNLPADIPISHRLCARAREGKRNIDGLVNWDERDARRTDESEVNYVIRLLVQEGFKFKDLDLPQADQALVIDRIKSRFYATLSSFNLTQPADVARLVDLINLPMVQTINYAPVSSIHFAELGTDQSLGLSLKIGHNETLRWLRYEARLMMNGLPTLQQSNRFAITPAMGLSYEPKQLSSQFLQVRFGLNFGYQIPLAEQAKSKCETSPEKSFYCRGVLGLGYVSLSFLERMRLSVGLSQILQPFEKRSTQPYLAFGIQGYVP